MPTQYVSGTCSIFPTALTRNWDKPGNIRPQAGLGVAKICATPRRRWHETAGSHSKKIGCGTNSGAGWGTKRPRRGTNFCHTRPGQGRADAEIGRRRPPQTQKVNSGTGTASQNQYLPESCRTCSVIVLRCFPAPPAVGKPLWSLFVARCQDFVSL